ncbi:wax ester/triacylglycerol synthase family O-acyltransferase [Marinobacter sp. chi1]|uniref:diacylglycerol O-acyltransferase n=1 Tax=Marinobacter suaedae TaxID=3057675 RepID=A0ABT8VVX7_9GAMM|nr:wax ester/triacylglycerol synthase family O-acyltransferase [Marinobacter sp. chi1]MDO3720133.1 wax ester/triacylglycerol synthase family O-acyltransferase [Marinobacter sp. chi1]
MSLRKLSLIDAASLRLEGRDMPMHVAGLMVFSYPEGLEPDQQKAFVTQLVERWRREIRVSYPWNQVLTRPSRWQLSPATRSVHDLDLEYHLRQWALPEPGGEVELGQMVAWIHGLRMDLRKPLWEFHFIEGLSDQRFAIYVKLHHALVDGISAGHLLVEGLSAGADEQTQPHWARHCSENDAETDSLSLPGFSDLKAAMGAALRLRRKDPELTTFASTPPSAINGPIGAQRRVATQHFELARLKKVAKEAGATLNDVVMTLAGGALRDYLINMNALPKESLTAALPVSTRKPGDHSVGNQVSMIFGALGTNVADPRERLAQITASTRAAKSFLQNLPEGATVPYSLMATGPFMSSVILGRAGHGRPIFNTVISNVPGQREERYLDGARLLHIYPVSLIMPGVPLNFTCCSHGKFLNFGIIACRDRVPKVQRIAVGLRRALEALENRP